MPYKDPEKQRQAVEKAVKKHRGITKGITEQGTSPEGIAVPEHLIPILTALGDKEKRSKIRLICKSLDEHNVTPEVRYGVNGPTMDKVSELLEAF